MLCLPNLKYEYRVKSLLLSLGLKRVLYVNKELALRLRQEILGEEHDEERGGSEEPHHSEEFQRR